jgi:hypothetical protein
LFAYTTLSLGIFTHTSRIGGEVVSGTDGEVAPPGDETTTEVAMAEDETVGMVCLLWRGCCVLGLSVSHSIEIPGVLTLPADESL